MQSLPFRFGDVVKGSRIEGEGIICECSVCQGRFEYGVSGTWWHDHDSLTLVREATPETVAQALQEIRDDEDEGEEWDEEEE